MQFSLVSIIIPVFNRIDIINETLDSVLFQSYPNWECLLIDDGSTDNVGKICNEYVKKDPRFKYLQRNRLPKGAPACRNIGLELSQGEYILFLDSDDILHENCLHQRIQAFHIYPDYDFLVFKSYLFEEVITDTKYYWNLLSNEDIISRFLKMDVLWQTSGSIYRKRFLSIIGGFKEDLQFWQDYDLHLRCLLTNAKYKLLFELPPDLYIRQGRKDTLSRKTPFTADIEILKKRINFFFDILDNSKYIDKLNQSNYKLITISVIYYFTANLFLKHGRFLEFLNNFKIALRVANLKDISIYKSILYILFLKLNQVYDNSFTRYLTKITFKNIPDYNFLANNTVGKIKIN